MSFRAELGADELHLLQREFTQAAVYDLGKQRAAAGESSHLWRDVIQPVMLYVGGAIMLVSLLAAIVAKAAVSYWLAVPDVPYFVLMCFFLIVLKLLEQMRFDIWFCVAYGMTAMLSQWRGDFGILLL